MARKQTYEELEKRVKELEKQREEIHIDHRSALIDPDGGEPYISGTERDMTERILAEREIRKLQKEMLQSRRMEALSTLAGGIAHRFNNALSAITGNADLLEMEFPGNDKIKRYITPMKKSAHQMAHLSSQLLAYAGGGKYNPEVISPTDLVNDTLTSIEDTVDPDIRIETDLPLDIMRIEADNEQMQMVLSAIITNSNEAIKDKGRITISAKNEDIDEDFVKAYPTLKPGPYVSITFEDNGKGMDEETKDRIFEPFFTTHFMVRGLGMAAVYGIVKNHDGLITVDSELGKGTRVVIYLPVVEVKAKKQKEPKADVVSGTATVLLVEDEDVVIEVTQAMLEKLGYRVIAAITGKDAVYIAQTFDGDIDLALLDIKLPDIKGEKVYRLIMEARPNLKVIVFSGYTMDGPARKILDAGAQDFIQKPFSLATLSEKLKKVLAGE
jgi:two-component system, cell cycle sensor histidine kinase and response regulator CckA